MKHEMATGAMLVMGLELSEKKLSECRPVPFQRDRFSARHFERLLGRERSRSDRAAARKLVKCVSDRGQMSGRLGARSAA